MPKAQPAMPKAQTARSEAQPASQPSLTLQAWLAGPPAWLDSPEGEMDGWKIFPFYRTLSPIENKTWPANSREYWAGALMEVRSLFGLNSVIKNALPTDH